MLNAPQPVAEEKLPEAMEDFERSLNEWEAKHLPEKFTDKEKVGVFWRIMPLKGGVRKEVTREFQHVGGGYLEVIDELIECHTVRLKAFVLHLLHELACLAEVIL